MKAALVGADLLPCPPSCPDSTVEGELFSAHTVDTLLLLHQPLTEARRDECRNPALSKQPLDSCPSFVSGWKASERVEVPLSLRTKAKDIRCFIKQVIIKY